MLFTKEKGTKISFSLRTLGKVRAQMTNLHVFVKSTPKNTLHKLNLLKDFD